MANLFRENAYNVLGLDTSASQKEINRRSKEISNLLKIDEESIYETDLEVAKATRTENTVKEAVQKLSSPTKKIREYFFWFDIESDNDEKALKYLQAGRIDEAYDLWSKDADKETAGGFVAKKNLAVLSSVLVVDKGLKKHLSQSITYWKDLVLSDKFWAYFVKVYALNDEVGTSGAALADFRNSVTDVLSDFYTEISQNKGDNSFYALFSQAFGVKGQKMQRDVLSPIYEAINDASEKLRNLNISEDNIVSPQEIMALKRLTKIIQSNLDKLKELGLYSDSQSKTMRDKAAEALRTVALDLYNNLNESEKPVALLNIASKIAGTPGTVSKINKDVDTLRENRQQEKVIKPINDLLEEEKYSEALDVILPLIPKFKNDKFLNEYLTNRLKWCVVGVVTKSLIENRELFEKEKYQLAAQSFANLREFIEQYIEYFDEINMEWLNGNVANIEQRASNVTADTFTSIAETRDKLVSTSSEAFPDGPAHVIVVAMLDCAMYYQFALKMPSMKRKRTASNIVSRIVGWVITLIIIGVIGAAFSGGSDDSSSGSSSSSSSYSICSDEYDSLKSQLDSVESRMTSYDNSGDTDSYNAAVPTQNSLVAELNSKATECNNLR